MANPNPNPATRFKKGQSGNPGGQRKGTSMTALARQLMDQPFAKGSPATGRELMLKNILAIATTSRGADAVAAAKLLWGYDEGTPVNRNEHAGPGEFDLSLDQARQVLRVVGGRDGD